MKEGKEVGPEYSVRIGLNTSS